MQGTQAIPSKRRSMPRTRGGKPQPLLRPVVQPSRLSGHPYRAVTTQGIWWSVYGAIFLESSLHPKTLRLFYDVMNRPLPNAAAVITRTVLEAELACLPTRFVGWAKRRKTGTDVAVYESDLGSVLMPAEFDPPLAGFLFSLDLGHLAEPVITMTDDPERPSWVGMSLALETAVQVDECDALEACALQWAKSFNEEVH